MTLLTLRASKDHKHSLEREEKKESQALLCTFPHISTLKWGRGGNYLNSMRKVRCTLQIDTTLSPQTFLIIWLPREVGFNVPPRLNHQSATIWHQWPAWTCMSVDLFKRWRPCININGCNLSAYLHCSVLRFVSCTCTKWPTKCRCNVTARKLKVRSVLEPCLWVHAPLVGDTSRKF